MQDIQRCIWFNESSFLPKYYLNRKLIQHVYKNMVPVIVCWTFSYNVDCDIILTPLL